MSDETPDYLIPRMGDLPVSSARYYKTASITRIRDDRSGFSIAFGPKGHRDPPTGPVTGPLDLPEPVNIPNGLPAEGVLLTHEQSWIIQGTALGPLLHSVSLAPGEITQIAVDNQTRAVHESSVDAGLASDDIASTSDALSDLDEEELSDATETTRGSTDATSNSTADSLAGSGSILGIGGSIGKARNTAAAHQASVSTGQRDVTDQNNQALHQRAVDQANSVRARHTCSVREVKESDRVDLQTRVLVNYNHMHALTMQYYEVEQVYRLRTRVTKAERLLFLPVRPFDFGDPQSRSASISDFRPEFIEIAVELGLHHVAARLKGNGRASELLTRAQAKPGATDIPVTTVARLVRRYGMEDAGRILARRFGPTDLARFRTDVEARLNEQRSLAEQARYAVLQARDDLRELSAKKDPTLVEKARLQDALKKANRAQERAGNRVLHLSNTHRALLKAIDQGVQAAAQAAEADQLTDVDMYAIMEEHSAAFNQGVWMRLSPDRVMRCLRGVVLPGETFDAEVVPVPEHLDHCLDPTPIAVSGNYVGFRWLFTDKAAEARFTKAYMSDVELSDSITLPTGGIFGEAVLGASNGSEKIDLSRFWNWKDALPPIRPTEIDAIGVRDQAPLSMPSTARMNDGSLDLGQIRFPNVSSGIPAVTAALGNQELFRDMSGKETAAAMASSAAFLSGKGADAAADLASKNYQRFLQLQGKVASALLSASSSDASMDPTLAGGSLNELMETRARQAGGPKPILKDDEVLDDLPEDPPYIDTSGVIDTY